MHSMCPPSPTFLLLLFTRMCLHMWDSHHFLYIALGDINNFHSSIRAHSRTMHVKQTVTPLLLRWYTHSQSFSWTGSRTQASATEAQLVYLSVILLRWKGLSFPESLLAVKGLVFWRHHNKPISQGCALCLCFLSTIFDSLWWSFFFFYLRDDWYCIDILSLFQM